MNIVEVKNNLVKLFYEEDLTLSGLVKIKDGSRTYIAQIIHLEASRVGKFAICKIIFNYTDKIHAYDGTIPSLRAEVGFFDIKEFLDILEHKDPILLGKSISPDTKVCVDLSFLKDNPIILAEKFFASRVLVNNFVLQLKARDKKVVVFDPIGIYKNNKLTLSKDFKLPLNSAGLDYIYEKEFEDATDESKVFVQPIFEELKEYAKTVEYIPFDTFKGVIDTEFQRTKLIQLIILKNKIKQIKDLNIYAEEQSEISVLKEKLVSNNIVVIDISQVKESVQKECIKYVYSILNGLQTEIYSFVPLNDKISDKNMLNCIFECDNVHSSVICDYDYSLLPDLKKASKDMIMFTPIKQQKDFGGYNIFLQRLAEDEFIAYGKMSKFVPVIGKLYPITAEDINIKPHKEVKQISEQSAQEEKIEPVKEPEQEDIVNDRTEVLTEETSLKDKETFEAVQDNEPVEQTEAESEPNTIVEEEQGQIEEIQQPEVLDVVSPEVSIAAVAGATAQEVVLPIEEAEEEISVSEEQAESIAETATPSDTVEDALNAVPDISDEDELSDDDLDMIEELSKPDEEIEVINEPMVEAVDAVENKTVQSEVEIEPQVQDFEQNQVVEPQEIPEQVVQEEVPENIVEDEETTELSEEEPKNDVPPETTSEPLQTRANTTPVVPEYSAEIPDEDRVNSDPLKEGDRIMHQEFGEGVVEKMINYGDKLLCSVNFPSVGRRLLNPEISEIHRL